MITSMKLCLQNVQQDVIQTALQDAYYRTSPLRGWLRVRRRWQVPHFFWRFDGISTNSEQAKPIKAETVKNISRRSTSMLNIFCLLGFFFSFFFRISVSAIMLNADLRPNTACYTMLHSVTTDTCCIVTSMLLVLYVHHNWPLTLLPASRYWISAQLSRGWTHRHSECTTAAISCTVSLQDSAFWVFTWRTRHSARFSTHFYKSPQYEISRKSVQWQPRCYLQTDGRTWRS